MALPSAPFCLSFLGGLLLLDVWGRGLGIGGINYLVLPDVLRRISELQVHVVGTRRVRFVVVFSHHVRLRTNKKKPFPRLAHFPLPLRLSFPHLLELRQAAKNARHIQP